MFSERSPKYTNRHTPMDMVTATKVFSLEAIANLEERFLQELIKTAAILYSSHEEPARWSLDALTMVIERSQNIIISSREAIASISDEDHHQIVANITLDSMVAEFKKLSKMLKSIKDNIDM